MNLSRSQGAMANNNSHPFLVERTVRLRESELYTVLIFLVVNIYIYLKALLNSVCNAISYLGASWFRYFLRSIGKFWGLKILYLGVVGTVRLTTALNIVGSLMVSTQKQKLNMPEFLFVIIYSIVKMYGINSLFHKHMIILTQAQGNTTGNLSENLPSTSRSTSSLVPQNHKHQEAIKSIPPPPPSLPQSGIGLSQINPICLRQSEMLQALPPEDRLNLEIKLLQLAKEFDYINVNRELKLNT
ncbi:hypothetical protein NQ317_013077 [Molorchus minor]|uniref:Uncharacterized protein n=1 Tax=Molorchus minor TaxID=1323400 RepID=A0ABQ9ISC1_9CUCU|nr:hypothetical protein NQ317_013077 [Molorchus minor]